MRKLWVLEMGCPAFLSACEETQARHPETEQGFCREARASVTERGHQRCPLGSGARVLPEILRKDKGTRCPALVLKLPPEVMGAPSIHNYWPKTGICPEGSRVYVSLRV